MAERATALAATVIVGTAAIGGVASGSAEQPARSNERSQTVAASRPINVVLPQARERKPVTHKQRTHEPAPAPVVVASPTEAVPSPTPPPPTPQPSPTSDGGASSPEKGSGSQSPAPAPKPFQVALGFERAGAAPSAAPQSHTFDLDCASMQLQQELSAPVWDEGGSNPGRLSLRLSGSSVQFDLFVVKNGIEYSYNGGAAGTQTSKHGSQITVSFSGSYGWNGGPPPTDASLPDSGRFSARIVFDCSFDRLVTESVALGA